MHALTADGWWRTVTIIPAWLWALHAKTLTCQARRACLCNSGSAIMSETNQSRPIGFKAHSTRKSSFISGTVNQDKNLGLRGGPESQWGSNFYGFSDGYDVPVRPSKYGCLRPQIMYYQSQLITTSEAPRTKGLLL